MSGIIENFQNDFNKINDNRQNFCVSTVEVFHNRAVDKNRSLFGRIGNGTVAVLTGVVLFPLGFIESLIRLVIALGAYIRGKCGEGNPTRVQWAKDQASAQGIRTILLPLMPVIEPVRLVIDGCKKDKKKESDGIDAYFNDSDDDKDVELTDQSQADGDASALQQLAHTMTEPSKPGGV